MKRMMIVLLALMIAVPAMAAVEVYVVDNGGGNVAIKYQNGESGAARPRAFGLDITVDVGTMSTFVAAKTGESVSENKGFGIFPGSILIDGNGNVTDWGSPLASGNGTAAATVELGSLYTGGNAPDASGDLLTFVVTESCHVSLAQNAKNGGVIKENGSNASPTLTGADILIGCATCPGDLSDDGWVGPTDLTLLVNVLAGAGEPNGYECEVGTSGCENLCADLSDDDWAGPTDLTLLVNVLAGAGEPNGYESECP